jgi:hypothetical protein
VLADGRQSPSRHALAGTQALSLRLGVPYVLIQLALWPTRAVRVQGRLPGTGDPGDHSPVPFARLQHSPSPDHFHFLLFHHHQPHNARTPPSLFLPTPRPRPQGRHRDLCPKCKRSQNCRRRSGRPRKRGRARGTCNGQSLCREENPGGQGQRDGTERARWRFNGRRFRESTSAPRIPLQACH